MNKMVKNSFVKTMLDELFNCNFQPKTISVRDEWVKNLSFIYIIYRQEIWKMRETVKGKPSKKWKFTPSSLSVKEQELPQGHAWRQRQKVLTQYKTVWNFGIWKNWNFILDKVGLLCQRNFNSFESSKLKTAKWC